MLISHEGSWSSSNKFLFGFDMIQFRCARCQQLLQAQSEDAGQLVNCPCGASLKVPGVAAAASPATVDSPPSTIDCSCGKRLRVPANAIGKAVRCPCGQVHQVEPELPTPVLPDFPELPSSEDNWLTNLPAAAPPPSIQELPRPKKFVPAAPANPPKPDTEYKAPSMEWVGGLLAMIGAVVWFVAGLAFGYIFFYPPVLFVLGLISFTKGMMR